jgi:DNA-directed RNA polymerase subunit RPC12/RpoP
MASTADVEKKVERLAARIDARMTKIQCPSCKEYPVWNGNECGVCGYRRVIMPRMTTKKIEQNKLIKQLTTKGTLA